MRFHAFAYGASPLEIIRDCGSTMIELRCHPGAGFSEKDFTPVVDRTFVFLMQGFFIVTIA
jgi:hypothetical protein